VIDLIEIDLTEPNVFMVSPFGVMDPNSGICPASVTTFALNRYGFGEKLSLGSQADRSSFSGARAIVQPFRCEGI